MPKAINKQDIIKDRNSSFLLRDCGMPCYSIVHRVLFVQCYSITLVRRFTASAIEYFFPQTFSTLHSFLLFSWCPWGWDLNLKFGSASCCGLKHSSSPTACLNHIKPNKSREIFV